MSYSCERLLLKEDEKQLQGNAKEREGSAVLQKPLGPSKPAPVVRQNWAISLSWPQRSCPVPEAREGGEEARGTVTSSVCWRFCPQRGGEPLISWPDASPCGPPYGLLPTMDLFGLDMNLVPIMGGMGTGHTKHSNSCQPTLPVSWL